MTRTAIKIGPADQGRRMSLADFDLAEVEGGYLYELGRGVIIVSDIPNPPHLAHVMALKQPLFRYWDQHPEQIEVIATGSECKLLVTDLESERHPDLAVYKTPWPATQFWSTWIPEIVIEVVSSGSQDRDCVDKREEYLAFGVSEYWIVDPKRQEILVLKRWRGRWTEKRLGVTSEYTTKLLPGFVLQCEPILRASKK